MACSFCSFFISKQKFCGAGVFAFIHPPRRRHKHGLILFAGLKTYQLLYSKVEGQCIKGPWFTHINGQWALINNSFWWNSLAKVKFPHHWLDYFNGGNKLTPSNELPHFSSMNSNFAFMPSRHSSKFEVGNLNSVKYLFEIDFFLLFFGKWRTFYYLFLLNSNGESVKRPWLFDTKLTSHFKDRRDRDDIGPNAYEYTHEILHHDVYKLYMHYGLSATYVQVQTKYIHRANTNIQERDNKMAVKRYWISTYFLFSGSTIT